jgi:D-alanine-D-alanine ligase
MRIAILHNDDFSHLPPGVSRNSQDSVLGAVASVEKALCARGATVLVQALGADAFALDRKAFAELPDLVVNLCESFAGDSRGELVVPALLDALGVPYTGSGPLALALSLYKHKAKDVLRGCGIPTPESALVERPEQIPLVRVPLPAIVKPAREDASIGIDRHSLARDARELAWACERVLVELAQPALVERYVDGRELNVALLSPASGLSPPQVLPVSEIDFSRLAADHPRIVTYAAKWDESAPEFYTTEPRPCALAPRELAQVGATAVAAFQALDLRDYGRVDLRLAADGTPYVIEVNPNCDLSPEAGFARAARAAGVSHEELVWRLVEIARSRNARPSVVARRPGEPAADARRDRRVPPGRGELRPGARVSGAR